MLIEVLVSAVLVAVIGVALFGALNSAAKVSGKSKTRAGAAAVAQDDQERMRAMPVATLNNFRDHRDPVVMGKTAYIVDSRAEWIADAKGATDCTANGAAADYLKITSTVSAKNIPLKPVVVTSTVTPAPGTFTSNEGSLAVSIVGADGTGRAGDQRVDQRPGQRRPVHRRERLRLLRLRAGRRLQRHGHRLGLRRPQRQLDRHGHVLGRQPDGRHPLAHLRPGAGPGDDELVKAQERRPARDGRHLRRARRASRTPASPPTSGVRYFGNGTAVKSISTPRRRSSRSPARTACSRATAPTTPLRNGVTPRRPHRRCRASSTTPSRPGARAEPDASVERRRHGEPDGHLQHHDGQLHEHLVDGRQDDDDRQPRRAPRRPGLPVRHLLVCVDNRFQPAVGDSASLRDTYKTVNAHTRRPSRRPKAHRLDHRPCSACP